MGSYETAKEIFGRGDFLGAYDRANDALVAGDKDPRIIHLAALALARSHAVEQALALLETYKKYTPDNDEEFLTLKARLLKDQYRATSQSELAERARDLYLAAFNVTGGYFPAINAATLSLLIGDETKAFELAKTARNLCENKTDYWELATSAEACLLLEDLEGAQELLSEASLLGDVAARSSTYQQLELICEQKSYATSLLKPLRPPSVIHYTGQMIHGIGSTPGIDPEDENQLGERVADLLAQGDVGFGYGALACGADLIVAEKLVERGAELHVILPFNSHHFKEISVSSAGPEWEERFELVLASAATVTTVVEEAICDYDLLFGETALQAMGMARLKGNTLGSDVFQVALWNGVETDSTSGTHADIRSWRQFELESEIIQVPKPRTGVTMPLSSGPSISDSVLSEAKRDLKALIFADVSGFSKLPEAQLPLFMRELQQRIARLVQDFSDDIAMVNTWGDAVFVVLNSVLSAAKIADRLARITESSDWKALGLPAQLGLRVSAHMAPVFYEHDPVLGKHNYFGMHVNKTARMEPCTPVGSVYVTEAFAAHLIMEPFGLFACEYAGEKELPKGFGSFRLYHLRRTNESLAAI